MFPTNGVTREMFAVGKCERRESKAEENVGKVGDVWTMLTPMGENMKRMC